MYYSKTCPPLEMLPIPESSARPVVPPANGKVSAQGTPVPVGPTIRILGPEYQFTGLSNVPPHPGTKFSPIIGFGWQGTSFEKFTAKLSKNSRAAVEEALGLPPGITLSDLTEGDVIYDKVDGFILKPGALPQIIERVGLKMTQGAARNPTPPQKGPFSEPPKPASELPPGLKKTTSGTGYAYVEDGTPDEIMIGFVGEDFAKPNSQKATEAQKQGSNGKLPTAATSTTATQQQKDKKALTDFRSRSADPPPSRSPLSGPRRDLRGTPSMNFAKKSPPGLPPAAVIIGAKRVLPPGSIPEPEIPGLNRDKVPMTSFGMYGVDENTHQQYFSIGEWLVSEGSMMWKKLLRERGVTGNITEEIKNTGWVLVKKAASSRSPYSILYPEFDWLEADLLCRVDEVIKHVKALEDLARKNGDRMIEYLTTPPEQLVINTGTACQMEMARNEDTQVGAADRLVTNSSVYLL